MSEVLVYCSAARADAARLALGQACRETGTTARLEVYGTGALFQRLGARRAPPPPDLVWWFGPFAAQAAASGRLLQAYQPAQVAQGVVHDPDWNWVAAEDSAIGVAGAAPVADWQGLAGVPRLAMADPERSEVGLTILLASLDRARQTDGDVEAGWAWWQRRAAGLALAEEDAGALALIQAGSASHALTLAASATPLGELAPIPHAVGLAAGARNLEAARGVLDWLAAQTPAATGPVLDVEWGREQYVAVRQRWAQSGFAPTLA